MFHSRPDWFQFLTATFCHANWWVHSSFISIFLVVVILFLFLRICIAQEDDLQHLFSLSIIAFVNYFLIISFYNLTNTLICAGNIFLATFSSYIYLVRRWQGHFTLLSGMWLVIRLKHEHLIFRCVAFATGKLVEEEGGSFALWLSYILTGVGANLVSWLILPRNTVSVGASGAVFGLFTISVLVKVHVIVFRNLLFLCFQLFI